MLSSALITAPQHAASATDQGPDTTTKPQTTARQLETHTKFEVCLKGNIEKSL